MGKTPGQFGLWLREELTRRGYSERGGLSQFARESDVHLSIISRVVNEGRAPEIDALRRIGKALGYTLGEMLIFAGVAQRGELPVRNGVGVALSAPIPDDEPEDALPWQAEPDPPVADDIEAELLADPDLDERERERWLRLHRNLKAEIREWLEDQRGRGQ